MASAAGGTSQRLNPGPATVRSRSRKPGEESSERPTAARAITPLLDCYGRGSGGGNATGHPSAAAVRSRITDRLFDITASHGPEIGAAGVRFAISSSEN